MFSVGLSATRSPPKNPPIVVIIRTLTGSPWFDMKTSCASW